VQGTECLSEKRLEPTNIQQAAFAVFAEMRSSLHVQCRSDVNQDFNALTSQSRLEYSISRKFA
jgi:hypothetical protein